MDDAEGNHVEPAITLLALHHDDDDNVDDNDDFDEEDDDDDMMLGKGMYGGVLTSDHGSKVAQEDMQCALWSNLQCSVDIKQRCVHCLLFSV